MTENGKLGVALIAMEHVHASGYADNIAASPDCEIVAVWDEDSLRGQKEAEKRGVKFEDDLDYVVGMDAVDGVVVPQSARSPASRSPGMPSQGYGSPRKFGLRLSTWRRSWT